MHHNRFLVNKINRCTEIELDFIASVGFTHKDSVLIQHNIDICTHKHLKISCHRSYMYQILHALFSKYEIHHHRNHHHEPRLAVELSSMTLSLVTDYPPFFDLQLPQVFRHTIHPPKFRSPNCHLHSSLKSIILLGISLLILCNRPTPRSLANLIIRTVRGDRQNSYNSSLWLILHSPFSCAGPYLFCSIFLSKVHSLNLAAYINVHVWLVYVRTDLPRVLNILTFVSPLNNRGCKYLWYHVTLIYFIARD